MSTEIEQEKDKAVAAFFRDPNVAKVVCDSVIRTKPSGWGRRSNSPYYKEVYALALKEVADDMIKTREDQVYFYKDFPGIVPTTLYAKVYQALRYLIDYLDTPDKHYARWSEMVTISMQQGVGVRISFVETIRDAKIADFKPRSVVSKAELPVWKQKVESYLEDHKQTKPFCESNLALTPTEIKDLRDSLLPVKGIIFHVKSYEIKIIKTNGK